MAREAAAEHIDAWHRHGHSPRFIVAWSDALLVVSLCRACLKSLVVGVGHEGAHVGVARDSGPMSSEDTPAEVVLLALPHNSHTGALEAEVESSDAAEE